jgi:hypothetical protein
MQIIIPHARRNNGLLLSNVPFICENLDHRSVVILTEKDNIPRISAAAREGVTIVDEDSICPSLTLAGARRKFAGTPVPERRAGWYFQQFLKMAWSLNGECDEWYVVWDSDTFPLRPITLFDEGGAPLFTASEEHNSVYFQTIEALVGLKRQVGFSFVAENLLIKRAIMREIIGEILDNGKIEGATFFEKIENAALSAADPYRAFSEFELYGNFAIARYPGLYRRTERRSSRKGARRFGLTPSSYDLQRLSRKYDVVSFEHWDRIIPPLIAVNKIASIIAHFAAQIRIAIGHLAKG